MDNHTVRSIIAALVPENDHLTALILFDTGRGTLTWPDGSNYDGILANGAPKDGKMIKADGQVRYFSDGASSDPFGVLANDRLKRLYALVCCVFPDCYTSMRQQESLLIIQRPPARYSIPQASSLIK